MKLTSLCISTLMSENSMDNKISMPFENAPAAVWASIVPAAISVLVMTRAIQIRVRYEVTISLRDIQKESIRPRRIPSSKTRSSYRNCDPSQRNLNLKNYRKHHLLHPQSGMAKQECLHGCVNTRTPYANRKSRADTEAKKHKLGQGTHVNKSHKK